MKLKRKKRLFKIKTAQNNVEDALLEMRKGSACNPTLEHDKAFDHLYYLLALAKKAP